MLDPEMRSRTTPNRDFSTPVVSILLGYVIGFLMGALLPLVF
jgi:hypothetical protein